MCGLVGVIARRPGGLGYKQIDIFEQMLILDTLRGTDSTGVMNIKGNGSVDVMKQAEQPYYMIKTKSWDTLKGRAFQTGKILAGHNRAATRGKVTNENAHPFYEKNIVLMHNGTLNPGWETLSGETKVDVDSHAICHALTTGTPEEIIPKIEGAFALLWYNLETETFHAVRNEERPLCLITTSDYYYLASESWMATIPLMRNTIKVQDNVLMEPGDLYSWTINGTMKIEKVKLHSTQMNTRIWPWMASQVYSPWEDDLGEPVSGKTTQVSYLPGALNKKETNDCSPSSKTCALTQIETSIDTTKIVFDSKKPDSTENGTETSLSSLEKQQSLLKVEDPNLPKGKEVMVKIWDVKRLPNGAIKWSGKLTEPGLELMDAQGFLPRDTPGNEWPSYIEQVVWGKVNHLTKTVCGTAVYVHKVQRMEQVMVHMGKLIPSKLWEHAHTKCTCRECGHKVEDWERDWTSVKLKGQFGTTKSGVPLNVVEMVCPDCIMRNLEGGIYARYSSSYYGRKNNIISARKGQAANSRPTTSSDPAVQDRLTISQEFGRKAAGIPTTTSGETLQ